MDETRKFIGFPNGHVIFADDEDQDHGHIWRVEGRHYASTNYQGEQIDPFRYQGACRGSLSWSDVFSSVELWDAPEISEAIAATLKSFLSHGYVKPDTKVNMTESRRSTTVAALVGGGVPMPKPPGQAIGDREEGPASAADAARADKEADLAMTRDYRAELSKHQGDQVRRAFRGRDDDPHSWFYRYGESRRRR